MRTDGSEFQTHGKDLAELVDQGVELLREKGVLRVHVLTSSLRPQETNFWRELGWETCPGEKLFHLHNPTAVQQLRFLPKGYSVGSATPSDIAYLESMVLPVPELAFQNWEFSLISRDLTSSDRYYRVVRYDGRPVGVAVAGRIGSTATFSHVWVCKKERHHGLGGHLVSSIVGEMAADGVKHIYLMTTPGNDVASEFWKRKGFCEIPGRGFLERDIEKKREKL
jgi:N-acetylglutamate synthase-like GNAT family acetyltransferase